MKSAGWSTRPLRDCGCWLSGGTPSRAQRDYWGGDIPWVSAKSMGPFELAGAEESVTKLGADNGARLVRPGTVLFVVRGMSLAKEFRVGVTTKTVTFNQDLKAIEPFDDVDSRYLAHFLRASEQRILLHVDSAAHGTRKLKTDLIEGFPVPLPFPEEQKRIAAVLDAADALRTKRREALGQLDILIQSTFFDMFGDPVTNPKNFPINVIADFYANKQEGTRCGPFGSALKKSELVVSGIPVWNMDNIDASGRMVLPFRMFITKDKYRELDAYSVQDGDVIISRAGTVGKMCVANPGCAESIISTNLIRVRFGAELLPIYFVSLMTYCKGRVGRLKTGPDGAFTHMSTGILGTLRFPYPPLRLQRRFACFVERVEQQKELQRKQLKELNTLFASLQSRAFRGEL